MTMQRRITMGDKFDLERALPALAKAADLRRIKATMLSMASANQPGTKGWYCLHVRPNTETTVEKQLIEAEIEALVLRDEGEEVVRRGRKYFRPPVAWMPGYVMVRCVPSAAAFVALRYQEGVLDIVGGMENPWQIRDRYLIEFQDIINQRVADEKAAAVAEEARKAHPFKVGDAAMITSGPFAGFECVVGLERKGRISRREVSTTVFGRVFNVTLPLASLERV
jgi:transcriptional antiterminator NusG